MRREEGEPRYGDEGFEWPASISRGSDFIEKRETIERGREALAARLRARYPEERADLLVIDRERAIYLTLPSLAPPEMRDRPPSWMPKYDPVTGAVYTSRWDSPPMRGEKVGGLYKRRLVEAGKYEIVHQPPGRIEVDLADIPKSWTVRRLVPQHVWDGIETALRQQDLVRKDYGTRPGVEQEVVEGLLTGIHTLADIFRTEKLQESDLTRIAEETEKFLASYGLLTAREEIRQRLVASMLRAADEDKRNRINPLVSRVRLRSAYLDTVRREVVARFVREKASAIYEVLYLERDLTRTFLTEARDTIDRFLDRHPVFQNPESFRTREDFPDAEITRLVGSLRGLVASTIRPVRVAPYLIPARLAEVAVTDVRYKSRRDQVELDRILEIADAQEELERPSAEILIRQRDPVSAERRLLNARTVLDEVLSDPDNSVVKMFD